MLVPESFIASFPMQRLALMEALSSLNHCQRCSLRSTILQAETALPRSILYNARFSLKTNSDHTVLLREWSHPTPPTRKQIHSSRQSLCNRTTCPCRWNSPRANRILSRGTHYHLGLWWRDASRDYQPCILCANQRSESRCSTDKVAFCAGSLWDCECVVFFVVSSQG